jgi:hypothetical protein
MSSIKLTDQQWAVVKRIVHWLKCEARLASIYTRSCIDGRDHVRRNRSRRMVLGVVVAATAQSAPKCSKRRVLPANWMQPRPSERQGGPIDCWPRPVSSPTRTQALSHRSLVSPVSLTGEYRR